jgi:hypothetical protein
MHIVYSANFQDLIHDLIELQIWWYSQAMLLHRLLCCNLEWLGSWKSVFEKIPELFSTNVGVLE